MLSPPIVQTVTAADRLAPSLAWIDAAHGRVFALVDGVTYEFAQDLTGLGAELAANPLRATLKIKSAGIRADRWVCRGRIEVPTWALGAFPVKHHVW